MAFVALASADVSHLSGYQYTNPGANVLATVPLELHTVNIPANYNSYIPPASGSPFNGGGAVPSAQPQQQQQRAQYQAQPQPAVQQRYTSGSAASYQQQPQAAAYRQQPQAPAYQQQPQAAAYQQPPQAAAYRQQPQQPSYQPAAQTGYQSAYQSQTTLPPIVTKHVYAFAAPEDPEEKAGPRYVQVGRARKNYKVIFIKAPTYGQSPVIPILPQNEDKTIVYVLSKKPSEQDIQLPEPPVTPPSKPEVFFLKYKTQQEADQAQQQIQGNPLGNSLKQTQERIKQLFLHAIAAYDDANFNGAVQPDIDVRAAAGSQTAANYAPTNYQQQALPNYLPPNAQ